MRILLLISIVLFSLPSISQEATELVTKGQDQVQRGNYKEALDFYNQALATDPESFDAYIKRAFAYAVLADYESAIKDYNRVIEMKPDLVIAYISRGSAYNKLEKFNLALQDFDRALDLDSDNSEAYNNRGWSKKGLGDKEGACADWKTSKKMGNEEAKIILKNNQC